MLNKLILALCTLAATAFAAAPETKVTFHGHAAFEIVTPKGHVLFIDPWLKNPLNPAAKDGKDPLAAITKADYILLTHGHFDHTGDSVELAKKTKARLVANFELASNMARANGYPADQMGMDTLFNVGGTLTLADGEVKVTMVPAIHSSGMDVDAEGKKPLIYGGNPGGFVVQITGGPTIYHSGDTAYFRDMELIGQQFSPDLALINIGGHFGMEPAQAAQAAKAVRAKLVVPQHYATFPVLTPNAKEFFAALDKAKIAHQEMQPGSTVVFSGRQLKH